MTSTPDNPRPRDRSHRPTWPCCAWMVMTMACAAPSTDEDPIETSDTGTEDTDEADPAAPQLTMYASGARLKARFHEVDGVRAFRGFFDAELDLVCDFSDYGYLGPSPTHQCRPSDWAWAWLYLDDTCTQQPLAEPDPCRPPTALRRQPRDGEETVHYRIPPEATPLSERAVYRWDGDRCVAAGDLVPGDYRIGQPLGPDAFALATSVPEELGDGLVAEFFEGADGSRRLTAVHRVGDKDPCFPVALGNDTRCVPHVTAQESQDRFVDEACSVNAFRVFLPQAQSTIALATTPVGDPAYACDPSYSVYSQHGAVAPVVYGVDFAGRCVPVDDTDVFLHPGPPLDPGDYPRLISSSIGDGNVVGEVWTTPSGTVVSGVGNLQDLARGPCVVRRTVAGPKCVPSGYSDTTAYRDASCSESLIGNSPCQADVTRFVREAGQACEVAAVYATRPYDGPVFVSTDDVSCSGSLSPREADTTFLVPTGRDVLPYLVDAELVIDW